MRGGFGKRLHRLGLKVAIADIDAKGLEVLAKELGAAHGESNVLAIVTDVSKLDDVVRLRDRVSEAWGEVSCGRSCVLCSDSLLLAGRCAAQ
jgi:hypothetical protein